MRIFGRTTANGGVAVGGPRSSRRRRAKVAVLSLVATLATMVAGMPATASSGSDVATPGLVALFTSSGTTTITYTACGTDIPRFVNLEVTSFMNSPLRGCEVLLVNIDKQQFELCAGSDKVPPAFQQVRQIVIRPGVSTRCLPFQR